MSLVVAGSAFASSKQFGNVQARWEGDTGVVYVYSYVEDIKKDGVSWDAYVWVKDSYGETVYTEGTTRGCGTKVEASKAKTINPFDSNKAGYRYVKEHK